MLTQECAVMKVACAVASSDADSLRRFAFVLDPARLMGVRFGTDQQEVNAPRATPTAAPHSCLSIAPSDLQPRDPPLTGTLRLAAHERTSNTTRLTLLAVEQAQRPCRERRRYIPRGHPYQPCSSLLSRPSRMRG